MRTLWCGASQHLGRTLWYQELQWKTPFPRSAHLVVVALMHLRQLTGEVDVDSEVQITLEQKQKNHH